MRKKSHISLALYIADSMDVMELKKHKTAFCIGSILPDCKLSFLTTRHEIGGTFNMVKEEIKKLTVDCDVASINPRAYVIRLGQIIHYLADYFTYPHNTVYDGSLKDHCIYEEHLKISLREYIRSGEAARCREEAVKFDTIDALFDFISDMHSSYIEFKKTVEEDCRYIVSLCHRVAEAIIHLLQIQKETVFNPVTV